MIMIENYFINNKLCISCRSKWWHDTSGVTFVIPLHYLHIFFNHNFYFPMRNVISLELILHDDRNIMLMKDGGEGRKFRFIMTDAFLKLRTASFEPRLRQKWLQSIGSATLTRSFQATKTVHFNIKAGSMNTRYSSIFSYSAIPAFLKVFFISEAAHQGNYQTPRFSYQSYGISSIQLFKSGNPLNTNNETVDMKIERHSYHHQYWYTKFREFYGENSIDITPDNFLSDFFCLCFNLSNLPILDGDSAIVLKPEDRVLAFVEGGTLDAIVEFSSPLKENTMIFFQGVYDLVSSFDADGLIVQ